ncbi:MAG TPA: OmpA family protein [Burkholderiales bacterium]|nr:OmpA family protein [Burkholderiales bacterium]
MKKLSLLAAATLLAAGCATQEAPKPAPAPEPAPAPAPAPTPAPAPAPAPKPVAEKVTFSTDVLFDFDRSVIKPEGRTKLDDLAGKVKAINLEVVIAVGYADRIGSPAYNQRLSVRRAEAIKGYLVSKGIAANRVYTEGKGEANPVTGDKCKNMGREHRSNKKLVECLAPDRRTEIEVIGTKR